MPRFLVNKRCLVCYNIHVNNLRKTKDEDDTCDKRDTAWNPLGRGGLDRVVWQDAQVPECGSCVDPLRRFAMMTYAIEMKNPHTNSLLNIIVEAPTALEAIAKAKAWNPGYSELVACELLKANI